MNAFERKIALRVVGVHAGIILVLLISSALRGCFKPKPKDLVTFIEFGGPAASVDLQQVARMEEPTPQQPSDPVPKPAPVPETVKPKPVPKPTPKPTPKPEPVKPKPKPKPKWKPTEASAIDTTKAKKVNETPSKPVLSASDISKALSGIASSGASSASPSEINAYLGKVMGLFYARWKPPATASSATGSAIVRISMRKNGQITKRSKIKSSGDALYDKTVMDAVNAVGTLPLPPSDYPYDYVEIIFTLDH